MTFALTSDFLNRSISNIYDCALDPGRWVDTLSAIRDEMDLAYLHVIFDYAPACIDGRAESRKLPEFMTPWDTVWLDKLPLQSSAIPGYSTMRKTPLDCPANQLGVVGANEFLASEFYRGWVEPQGLLDMVLTPIIRREADEAIITAPTRKNRGPLTEADFQSLRLLAPHFRRALLINEAVGEGTAQAALHQKLLDQLSIAVCIVNYDCKILLSNTIAEQMMEERLNICQISGRLRPVSVSHLDSFRTAIEKACFFETALNSGGDSIALKGREGKHMIAHILPLGRSERRHALGPGQVAVFITNKEGARPPAVEVLSAATGLSIAEARVALAIADGTAPEAAAQPLGISLNTFRKHLANIYGKTGLNSQSGLAAMVNRLRLPTI